MKCKDASSVISIILFPYFYRKFKKKMYRLIDAKKHDDGKSSLLDIDPKRYMVGYPQFRVKK